MKKLQLFSCLLIIGCLLSAKTAFSAEIVDSSNGTNLNITVPTSVLFYKKADGTIIVPDNTAIQNNSTNKARIEDVQVNVANDWVLETYGTDMSLESEDSKKFSLRLNNEVVNPDGSIALSEENWGEIAAGNKLPLSYDAQIPRLLPAKEKIAQIVFTISCIPPEPGDIPDLDKDVTDPDELALWTYTIDSSTNTATVVSYNGEFGEDVDIIVPASFEGAKTTRILANDNWLQGVARTLYIPSGVTINGYNSTSGIHMFSQMTIDTVYISDGCVMKDLVFSSSDIKTINIGRNVTINKECFVAVNIDTLLLASEFSTRPFKSCTIKNIKLGKEIKTLNEWAFEGVVYSIESIEGLENVETIASYALFNTFSKDVVIDELTISATCSDRALNSLNCKTLILDGAVIKQRGLDSGNIDTMIIRNTDLSASSRPTSLVVDTMVIEDGNTYGTAYSFETAAITNVVLKADVTSPLFGGNKYIQNVVIEDGCTSIADNLFRYNTGIKTITGLENLRNIGAGAFEGAFSDETEFGDWTFNDCTIGSRAFYQSSNSYTLNSLTLNNCTVGSDAFQDKWILNSVTMNGGNYGTTGIFARTKIGTLNILNNASFGKIFSDSGSAYATIETVNVDCPISDSAFYYSAINTVNILDGCTSIGANAFNSCKTISTLTGLKNVRSIGQYAFVNAFVTGALIDNLELTDCEIAQEAFRQNSVDALAITNLTLNNCTVGKRGFSYIPFTTLTINGGNYTGEAFERCTMDTLEILGNPVYVQSFSGSYYCTIGTLVTESPVPNYGFYNCSITEALIYEGCTSIGSYAFKGVKNLTEIELPADCVYQNNSFESTVTVTTKQPIANLAFEAEELENEEAQNEVTKDEEVKEPETEPTESPEGNSKSDETVEQPTESPEVDVPTDESTTGADEPSVDDTVIEEPTDKTDSDIIDDTVADDTVDEPADEPVGNETGNELNENNGTEEATVEEPVEDVAGGTPTEDTESSDTVTENNTNSVPDVESSVSTDTATESETATSSTSDVVEENASDSSASNAVASETTAPASDDSKKETEE